MAGKARVIDFSLEDPPFFITIEIDGVVYRYESDDAAVIRLIHARAYPKGRRQNPKTALDALNKANDLVRKRKVRVVESVYVALPFGETTTMPKASELIDSVVYHGSDPFFVVKDLSGEK